MVLKLVFPERIFAEVSVTVMKMGVDSYVFVDVPIIERGYTI